MNRMHSSHESAPAGRADGVDVIVVQNESTVCEGIDVGSGDLVGAVKADVIPSL